MVNNSDGDFSNRVSPYFQRVSNHMWISAHCFFVLVCARDTVTSGDNQGGEEAVTPRGRDEGREGVGGGELCLCTAPP